MVYLFSLPRQLFDNPTCMVLEDKDGNLLGARIAGDGQYRFPPGDSIPMKFEQSLIEFEDRRFYRHPGVDPRGLARAVVQNIKNKRIVSGGSTLSMQVIRMSRGKKRRSVLQKLIEITLATRLELRYSKKEILGLYTANAPFGGNVVGLEAASWRYFGKRPDLLSWGEAAMLAVLPNSPGLIHPGRQRQALFEKRNRLLTRLKEKGTIDEVTWELACSEPLPQKPLRLPQLAPHLLDKSFASFDRQNSKKKSRIRTTIDASLQSRVTSIIDHHHKSLSANQIHNLAAVVMDVETGNILAYVGNAPEAGEDHGVAVDIVTARRSTGSILKPFLYTMMIQEGEIIPQSLIQDVPTLLSGYRPENFHEKYDGAVTAKKAISRSLNVPLVHMLHDYGLEKFHHGLKEMGLSTIDKQPGHYGLTLILGGAEVNLLEVTNAYACMARTLNHFYDFSGEYNPMDFRPANYILEDESSPADNSKLHREAHVVSAAAAWLAFDAMQEVERPDSEGGWENFRSRRRIAWKTGTSFGFRDAWAIGVTPKYAVGVWTGNADGEGRPGLIGVLTSGPVLFDIFNALPNSTEWFEQPYDEMREMAVCRESGYLPLPICPLDTVWAPVTFINADPCPYHKTVHLDQAEKWQVNASCEAPDQIVHKSWFVLPPLSEYYYKSKNPTYAPLPPFREDCQATSEDTKPMQLIYPKRPTRIFVPTNLDGQLSRTVFSVAHRDPGVTIHWHIDDEYIGWTKDFHSKELNPPEGDHLLTLVDETGNRLVQKFVIIKKN
ncbi:MAG: penicillin-binding protein 1C [Bacteroidetes bacterium]|nr:MAG: penicillin-binding protein 1C [Bacteroidota bacterium]